MFIRKKRKKINKKSFFFILSFIFISISINYNCYANSGLTESGLSGLIFMPTTESTTSIGYLKKNEKKIFKYSNSFDDGTSELSLRRDRSDIIDDLDRKTIYSFKMNASSFIPVNKNIAKTAIGVIDINSARSEPTYFFVLSSFNQQISTVTKTNKKTSISANIYFGAIRFGKSKIDHNVETKTEMMAGVQYPLSYATAMFEYYDKKYNAGLRIGPLYGALIDFLWYDVKNDNTKIKWENRTLNLTYQITF